MAESDDITSLIKLLENAFHNCNQVTIKENEELELKIEPLTAENSPLRRDNVPQDWLLNLNDKLDTLKSDVQLDNINRENEKQLPISQIQSFAKERVKHRETIGNLTNKPPVIVTLNQKLKAEANVTLETEISERMKDLSDKSNEILCLEDDKKKLVKEIYALKKKYQKMADTEETQKTDLKKEIKSLLDEKTNLLNTVAKLKLDISKLKEKHSKDKSILEESLKRDLVAVVEQKFKLFTDYQEIKSKNNELNNIIASKNVEIEDLNKDIQSKGRKVAQLLSDSAENDSLKLQLQYERSRFQQRQTQYENGIRELFLEKNNLKQSFDSMTQLLKSRELQLGNVINDSKNAELRMGKFITESKNAEAWRELQMQKVIAENNKTVEELQNLNTEATSRLQADYSRASLLIHEVEGVVFKILDNDLSCCICNEIMVRSNILNCSHFFCEACIRDWSEDKQECPICHTPILMQKHAALLDTLIKTLRASYDKLNDFKVPVP